jgi:hypothetical protein
MNKRELQHLLDQSRSRLVTLSRDLDLAASTVSRWGGTVPAYARAWAAALAVMTPEQAAEARRLARIGQEPNQAVARP